MENLSSSPSLTTCVDRLLNVMAHEYCHLATYMINGVGDDHHGKLFQEW